MGSPRGLRELATLASDHDMGDAEVGALAVMPDHCGEEETGVDRDAAQAEPAAEEGAQDLTDLTSRGYRAATRRRWAKLPALADLYAHRNVAFIGPGGIGKTHLAQAYGRECCMRTKDLLREGERASGQVPEGDGARSASRASSRRW